MSYDSDNIFAKILRKEVACNIFYEDDVSIAFEDMAPAAQTHYLVIPKAKFISFDDFASSGDVAFKGQFFTAVAHVVHKAGLKEGGYRLIMNHGAHASQTVPHFHVHVLGGQNLGGLLPNDNLLR